MPDRTRYEANVCVLLHRAGRWLLSVRSADVDYAPGQVGLIGGHVEPTLGPDVLENTARREVLEETGLDLSDTALSYLGSELYRGAAGQPVLTVTFVGELSEGAEPEVADRAELTAVAWWTPDELAAADVPPWILPLVRAAADLTR